MLPGVSPPRLERLHDGALVGYAAALGLLEGPAQIACVVVLVLALATRRAHARGAVGLLAVGIGVWWLAGLPGLLQATQKISSGAATSPLMALAAGVGAWSLAPAPPALRRRVATAFLVALAVNAAYGLLQYAVGALPWDGLFVRNPKSGQLYIPGRVFHEYAASGLYYNRLRLAHVGVVGLAVVGAILLRPDPGRRARLGASALGGILALGVGLTYARMAWVGLVLGTGLALLVAGPARAGLRRAVGLLALVAAAGAAFVGGTEYGGRRLSSLVPDLEIRRAMFEAAAGMIADHPVFGVGHGVYRTVVEQYAGPRLSGVHLTSPHDQWLQVAAETGVVGLLGFTVAWGVGLFGAIRGARRHRSATDRAVLVGLAALSAIGLVHTTLHHAVVGLVFWTLVGAGAARGLAASGSAE